MNRWSLRSVLVLIFTLLLNSVDLSQQPSSSASQLTSQVIVSLSIKGRTITSDEAKSLEQLLDNNPFDLASRFTLISYYAAHFSEQTMKRKKCDQVLWMIENVPSSPALHYVADLRLVKYDQCFMEARQLWLKQVESNKGNLQVLRNAIDFFMVSEKPTAERFIKQGAAAEPQNPEWPNQLGQFYALQITFAKGEGRKQLANDAYPHFEQALKLTTEVRARQTLRLTLARMALEAGDTKTSESLASALLAEADQGKSDWFRFDLIHGARTVLGRVALKNGDVPAAKRELIASGEVEGSPVLNSFGPSMMLAKELLDKGERDVVLEYFLLISSFWKNEKLPNWTQTVKAGGVPNFGVNLSR